MKTYSVGQLFNTTLLQQSLTAAGVNVITINASYATIGAAFAISGTVTTDDNAIDATVNSVIAAIPTAQLAFAQQQQITALWAQETQIRAAVWDLPTWVDLLTLYTTHSPKGINPLPNRFAYVLQAFQWTGSVSALFVTAQQAVNAAQTVSAALAVQLGTPTAPPTVTIPGALIITT